MIKFADEIIKEIEKRQEEDKDRDMSNYVTGEAFEKWLRREEKDNGNVR